MDSKLEKSYGNFFEPQNSLEQIIICSSFKNLVYFFILVFKMILLLSEDIVLHQKHWNTRDTFPQPNELPENL